MSCIKNTCAWNAAAWQLAMVVLQGCIPPGSMHYQTHSGWEHQTCLAAWTIQPQATTAPVCFCTISRTQPIQHPGKNVHSRPLCGFRIPAALSGVAADVYSSCIHKLLSRSSCEERVLWMLSVIYARLRYAADAAAAAAGAASGMQGTGSVKQWNAPDKAGRLLCALAVACFWCGMLRSHLAIAATYCSLCTLWARKAWHTIYCSTTRRMSVCADMQ
jgi:hypothetical protein